MTLKKGDLVYIVGTREQFIHSQSSEHTLDDKMDAVDSRRILVVDRVEDNGHILINVDSKGVSVNPGASWNIPPNCVVKYRKPIMVLKNV